MLFSYQRNRSGASTDPCGTPDITSCEASIYSYLLISTHIQLQYITATYIHTKNHIQVKLMKWLKAAGKTETSKKLIIRSSTTYQARVKKLLVKPLLQ